MASYRTGYKNGRKRYKYRYRINVEGKERPVQRETGWHYTKKEAEIEYFQIIAGEKEKTEKKAKLTVSDLLAQYEELLQTNADGESKYKKSTAIDNYRNIRALKKKYFLDDVSNKLIDDLKPQDFSRWINYINSDYVGHDPLSGNIIALYRRAIYLFSKYLTTNGYVDASFHKDLFL